MHSVRVTHSLSHATYFLFLSFIVCLLCWNQKTMRTIWLVERSLKAQRRRSNLLVSSSQFVCAFFSDRLFRSISGVRFCVYYMRYVERAPGTSQVLCSIYFPALSQLRYIYIHTYQMLTGGGSSELQGFKKGSIRVEISGANG
jgi:hypothetical protein